MDLPLNLRAAVEEMLEGSKPAELKKAVGNISDRYKNDSGRGKSLIATDLDAEIYAAFRLPATFGAVTDALSYVRELLPEDACNIRSLTDCGAGSGAGSWAAREIFDPGKISMLEREESMIRIGQRLLNADEDLKNKARYERFDLLKDEISEHSDLLLSSYVLNELDDGDVVIAARKMWEAADKLLVVVEPGTPKGFEVIRKVRETVLSLGGFLLAPCPHDDRCRIAEDDWCHFACRVQRSRLHKMIKDASVPYEDEKYCYIAFSREEFKRASMRVLRHPFISKGQVDLSLCTATENKKLTLRKRDGDLYKRAKKSKQGDAL